MRAPSARVAFVVALAAAPAACTAFFPLSGLGGGDTGDDATPTTEGSTGEVAAGEGSPGDVGASEGSPGEASSGDASAHDATPGSDAPTIDVAHESAVVDVIAETLPESAPVESGTVTYAQTVLADSPLAYWRLDEPAGATTALDSSGHGVNGTYKGTVSHAVAGAIVNDPDTATFFDGNTGYVDVGAVFAFAGAAAFSLEAWAQPVLDANYHGLLSRCDNSSGPQDGYLMFIEPQSRPYYDYERILTPGTQNISESNFTATSGAWAHVVATFDGSTIVLYVNGKVENTTAGTVSLPTATSDFVLAAESGGTDSPWWGALDEVAVYDHALSGARVAEHYKVGMGLGP
jgi:hypothetical protein